MPGVVRLWPITRTLSLRRPSFRRRLEGGFTFEVQHVVPEDFHRSPVVLTLAGRIIVQLHQLGEPSRRDGHQVSLAGQPATRVPDGVLHPDFLPGRVLVTAEGCDPDGMEVVARALGAIVEGDGLAPGGGKEPSSPA